jgi:SAM-dependent methyltransferase
MTRKDLNTYERDYAELPFERIAETFRRRRIISDIERRDGIRRILEVGCGYKSIFSDLDNTYGGTIVEPVSAFLERQRSLQGRCGLFLSTLENLDPLVFESHDCVLLSSILHEVENPVALLRHSLKFLRKDGFVICVVPNGLSIHRFIGQQKGIIDDLTSVSDTQKKMQQRAAVFTPSSLRDLVTSAGVSVVEHSTFFPKLLSHAQMQHSYDQGLLTDEFLEILDRLSEECDPSGSEIILVGTNS